MCDYYIQRPHNSRAEIEPEAGTRLKTDNDSEALKLATYIIHSEHVKRIWVVT